MTPANLDPDVVAAPGGDNRELLSGKLSRSGQLVLDGAELVERLLQLDGQKLRDDAVHGFEREPFAGQLHLAGRRHHVRFVAGMHHQRFPVDADDGLEQRGYEAHRLPHSDREHLFIRLHTEACANPRMLRFKCRRNRSGPLGTTGRADFIDTNQFHQLVPAGLVRRDDPFGPQVLQHPLVAVVRLTNIGDGG